MFGEYDGAFWKLCNFKYPLLEIKIFLLSWRAVILVFLKNSLLETYKINWKECDVDQTFIPENCKEACIWTGEDEVGSVFLCPQELVI